jgi:YD repeat-containing protein
MTHRNLFFRLFLILLLFCATAGRAQETTGSDDNLADRLAQFDREIQKLSNDVDDLGREINNAIAEGQEDWARLANGGLLPGFAERLSAQLPWFELQLGIGTGGSHDRSCSNTYGATLEIPFGSYEGNQILNLSDTTVNPPVPPLGSDFNRALTAWGGAWSFEPGGMLIRMVELVDADVTVTPEPQQFVDCKTTIRYRYVGARGDYTFTKRGLDDEQCSFRVDNSSDPKSCGTGFFGGARYPAPCPRGAQYWSTQGQVSLDMSNESAPRLLFPDGTVEVMGRKKTDWPDLAIPPFFPSPTIPFYAHHQSLYTGGFSYSAFTKEAYWTTDRMVDRNGNRTLYEYDAQTGRVSGVVDPRGRRTSYSRDGRGYVTAIAQPGFGGTPLTWTLTWQDFTWTSPNNTFPEINCVSNWNSVACPDQTFTTLTRMALPDGRAYQFGYGPWGNLTQASSPDGAVTVYEYGNHDSTWFKPPYLNYIDGLGGSHFGDRCPEKMKFILKRRLVRTTITPSPGTPGATPQVTSVDHAQEVQLRTTSDPHAYYIVQWMHTTRPDGTVRKTGICQGNAAPQGLALGSPPTAIDGRILAEEIWGPSGLVEGTYYGNTGTIGDTSTPIGTMYMDWETPTAATQIPSTVSGNIYDVRPTKAVHVKDGVRWTETFTYDVSDIPANFNQLRTFGNVTSTLTADGLGNALHRVDTSFITDPAYVAKNLIHLPDTVTVREGGGHAVTRARYVYDQLPLMATGAPNLEDPGPQRGNVTTTTAYKDPHGPSGEVTTTVRYHDTGEPRQTTDPRGAQTTTTHPAGDFAECSVQPQDTLTAVNALGHTTSTVSDCWTGLPVTVTDANGQITRTAYDRLSRMTTVTSPGDPTPPSGSSTTSWARPTTPAAPWSPTSATSGRSLIQKTAARTASPSRRSSTVLDAPSRRAPRSIPPRPAASRRGSPRSSTTPWGGSSGATSPASPRPATP